jgi:hypothetical protein
VKYLSHLPWASDGLGGVTAIKIKSLPTESFAFLRMSFGMDPLLSKGFVSQICRPAVSMISFWYRAGRSKAIHSNGVARPHQ